MVARTLFFTLSDAHLCRLHSGFSYRGVLVLNKVVLRVLKLLEKPTLSTFLYFLYFLFCQENQQPTFHHLCATPRGTAAAVAQVVECAVANTWRLPVVWELVSGHLRVVAKAREPAKREYAVRALRELIVDGVQRLHPLPAASSPAPPDSSNDNTASPEAISTGTGPSLPANASSAPPGNCPGSAADAPTTTTSGGDGGGGTTAAPPTARGGNGSPSGQEEGFLPNFLGLRARLEGFGEEEAPFRWVFDCDVGGVFLAVGGRAARRTTVGGGEAFEGVLFRTMGLFALTPHVDTREATLQSLYTILQARREPQVVEKKYYSYFERRFCM